MADTKDAEDAKDLGVTEKFDDYVLGASGPIYPTAVDATGQERIVGPKIDNWQPAQVEPDPDEVERLEKVMAAQAEARQTRLGLLSDTERLGDTAKPLVEANKAEHGSSSSSRRSSAKESSS
jgi:hypothetical protein